MMALHYSIYSFSVLQVDACPLRTPDFVEFTYASVSFYMGPADTPQFKVSAKSFQNVGYVSSALIL